MWTHTDLHTTKVLSQPLSVMLWKLSTHFKKNKNKLNGEHVWDKRHVVTLDSVPVPILCRLVEIQKGKVWAFLFFVTNNEGWQSLSLLTEPGSCFNWHISHYVKFTLEKAWVMLRNHDRRTVQNLPWEMTCFMFFCSIPVIQWQLSVHSRVQFKQELLAAWLTFF